MEKTQRGMGLYRFLPLVHWFTIELLLLPTHALFTESGSKFWTTFYGSWIYSSTNIGPVVHLDPWTMGWVSAIVSHDTENVGPGCIAESTRHARLKYQGSK